MLEAAVFEYICQNSCEPVDPTVCRPISHFWITYITRGVRKREQSVVRGATADSIPQHGRLRRVCKAEQRVPHRSPARGSSSSV